VRPVETLSELEALTARLAAEPLLAVDTEAASFHRYHDRVYLLQISSRTETAVIDPLAVGTLAPLAAALADRQVEIVFHDADYDLRLIDREYGFRVTNLFDTRIAAQLLNEPGIGLAALLEKHFGLRLDKRFQRADWSARPLTPPMLEYAASDTRDLPALRDILREQLRARGRLEWAEEEFALLEDIRGAPAEGGEPGWLRLKGAKALKPREPMLLMARQPPADVAALKTVPGIGGGQIDRFGQEILAAVKRGVELPDHDLPRVERAPRRPPDPALEARLERLKAVRNRLASEYDLAPGVLCPNGTLEAVARVQPKTLDELAAIRELRRWQLREIGEELLKAVPEAAVTG
jgi:ribonuclease D